MASKRKKMWSRRKRLAKQSEQRQAEVSQPSEDDYHEVFHIDASFQEIAAKVLRAPNSALKTPLVEDEESINGASG